MAAEPFIGEISLFAGNFAPRGWALCDGQLLAISQHAALFSILGTTYGGDGRTNFALPDLRGRSPVHAGDGAGLSDVRLGERGGAETSQLTVAELPAHAHEVRPKCHDDVGEERSPNGNYPSQVNPRRHGQWGPELRAYDANGAELMGPTTSSMTGDGQPFTNRSPYLGLNYIIALTGLFPSRN